jgi:hypothetical protein
MTSEQRMKIADLPVVTLFDANGLHQQQALAPVFQLLSRIQEYFRK